MRELTAKPVNSITRTLCAALIIFALVTQWFSCSSPTTKPEGFVLPFPVGQEYKLIQGNNGPFGHEGHIAYAFDFIMPIGSVVVAARSGKVVKIEQQYVDGTKKPGQENYIFIQHSDSTYSRYYHLTNKGVLVQAGKFVARGDTIGSSGNTGASAGPHLHFDVTKGCPEWGCQTIPVNFMNAPENPLQTGKKYLANPY